MLRKLNSLIPTFLKSIDKYLLLNRPGLWATRIHYVLFFVLVFGGLLMVNAIVRPIDLADVPSPEAYFKFLIIPCLLALGIWAYRVSLFQVEKEFGKKSWRNRLRDQVVYAGVILLLAAIPYLYGEVLSYKISNSISDEELNEEINLLVKGFTWNDFQCDLHIREEYRLFKYPHTLVIRNHYSDEEGTKTHDDWADLYIDKYSSFDSKQNSLLNNEQVQVYFDEVGTNLTKLMLVKNHIQLFQQNGFLSGYLFLLVLIWLVFQAFLYIGWKQMILSIALGFISFGGIGLLYSGISYLCEFDPDDDGFPLDLLSMMVLGGFVFLLFQAYWSLSSKRSQTWKSINLTLAVFMTPIVSNLIILIAHINPPLYNSVILTIVSSILAWNIFYQPRFAQLQTIPKDN